MHLLDLVVLAPRFNKFQGASSCMHFAGSLQSRSELDLSTDSMTLSCITPPLHAPLLADRRRHKILQSKSQEFVIFLLFFSWYQQVFDAELSRERENPCELLAMRSSHIDQRSLVQASRHARKTLKNLPCEFVIFLLFFQLAAAGQ